jgi:hypothetical protein
VRRAASDGDPGESEGAPQSKKQLHKIAIARCPFANLPMGKHGGWNEGVSLEEMPTMTWVEPHLVVQVSRSSSGPITACSATRRTSGFETTRIRATSDEKRRSWASLSKSMPRQFLYEFVGRLH